MNSLIKFLKEENSRVEFEDKWLVYCDGEWLVLTRHYKAKHNTILYRGIFLGKAVEVLKESKEE